MLRDNCGSLWISYGLKHLKLYDLYIYIYVFFLFGCGMLWVYYASIVMPHGKFFWFCKLWLYWIFYDDIIRYSLAVDSLRNLYFEKDCLRITGCSIIMDKNLWAFILGSFFRRWTHWKLHRDLCDVLSMKKMAVTTLAGARLRLEKVLGPTYSLALTQCRSIQWTTRQWFGQDPIPTTFKEKLIPTLKGEPTLNYCCILISS